MSDTTLSEDTSTTTLTGDDLGESAPPATPDEQPAAPAEAQPEGQPGDSGEQAAPSDSTSDADAEDKVRRGRGLLEVDVRGVTDAYVTGEITLAEGEALTPHRIGKLIKDRDGLDKAPSTGAIVNIIKKWAEVGFAEVNEKPLAFTGYTQAAQTQGLNALKEAHAAANPKPRKERKAKSTDTTAAAPAAATGDGSTDTAAGQSEQG